LIEQNIINELKKYHTGKENAITYKDLAVVFDLNERMLRDIVSELVTKGNAIASTSDAGYFFISNEQEYQHAYGELISRIKALARRAKGLRQGWLREKQEIKPKQLILI